MVESKRKFADLNTPSSRIPLVQLSCLHAWHSSLPYPCVVLLFRPNISTPLHSPKADTYYYRLHTPDPLSVEIVPTVTIIIIIGKSEDRVPLFRVTLCSFPFPFWPPPPVFAIWSILISSSFRWSRSFIRRPIIHLGQVNDIGFIARPAGPVGDTSLCIFSLPK